MQISEKFFKFSGVLLIFGGLIAAIGHLLKPQEPTTEAGIEPFISQALLSDSFLVVGIPIVVLGLVGIFLRQSGSLKWWGWIAYPATAIGILYADLIQPVIRIIAYPFVLANTSTEDEIYTAVTTIYDQDPFGYFFPVILLSLIGPLWAAFCFWKAKVFPTWLVILLALLLPIFILSPMVGFYNFPAYLYVVFGIYGFLMIRNFRPSKKVVSEAVQ
ncbi:hypothetical protein EKG37_18320 [Robertmurraya yapensis]|uniref:DUF4386 domain-containing protein n=2 Tax=Bacillaceae TaxID=186817 RepID=A0A3S0I9Q8_9BACI|nr:hypothetical protein [Bacillus yapensis]RTR27847.1 hypothetical protein EKG37_18320 [Bacillus yapensis]TKS94250.1 hypothetical protein FAR12_18330 [Bacillus yapensis]